MKYLYAWRNYLRNYKEFLKLQERFHVLLSTIFYKRSGTFNETFSAGFCFLINLKFKKVSASLLASLALSKNKNSKASRLILRLPLPMLSFSKCWVCLLCLFTPFLSVLIVFRWKNLVLLHQMNRCKLSTSV